MTLNRHPTSDQSSSISEPRAWQNVGIAILAALLFTGVSLSFSGQYGRLLFEVDYEDVITHIDGLQRYRDLSEGGVLGYLRGYVEAPPHAPLHSLLATVSFGIFGVHDASPYIGNFLVILGYFGAVLYVLPRSTPIAVKSLGLVFSAGFPVAFLSVHDFRPDYPAAVFSVWGVLLLLDWNPLRDAKLRCWLAGFAFAATLLWKPTVFPYTMAIGGVALTACVIRSQIPRFNIGQTSIAIVKTWPFFAANAILALPHFIIAGPKLIEYMIRNQIGADKASWSLKGSFWENSTYHFLGYSGDFQLGQQKWLLLVVLGVALVVFLSNSKAREVLGPWQFGAGCVVTAIAFFGVAINHHDNPYFGLVFQILLILLCALVLVRCWDGSRTFSKVWRYATGVVLALLLISPVVIGSPWPKFRHAANLGQHDVLTYSKTINRDIMDLLKRHLASADQGNVLITTYGLISNHTLQWMADKEALPMTVTGLPNKSMQDLHWIINQQEQHHQVVDFIIATEPGAYGVHAFLPSAKTAGEILEVVQTNSDFEAIGSFTAPGGAKVHVFQRSSNFGGWSTASGLSARVLAERDGNLPARQFACWPSATLVRDSATADQILLEMRWVPVAVGTSVSVLCNGEPVFQSPQTTDRSLQSASIPLSLKLGTNSVELVFDGVSRGVEGKPAVTFTRLKFAPVSDLTP